MRQKRKLGFCVILYLLFIILTGNVAATVESAGPGGYGWQQVYTSGTSRLTGSSDRRYYDWGYKWIQVSGRRENYYESDCGWWYVTAESTLNISIEDAAGDYLVRNQSITTTKGQTGEITYPWGGDDDPGRWNVTFTDGTNYARFYVYVRGQLNVTSIAVSPSPTTGSPVTINATLKDNTGNLVPGNAVDNEGNSSAPAVTAYVSGAGENFEVALTDDDNDGIWNGTFTPQKMGDHKIVVKASDGHSKWVDGRGSTKIAVSGTFPYASAALSIFIKLFGDPADMPRLPALFAPLIGLALFRCFGDKSKHLRDGA